jgi:thiol-disulfide isomerase/thioredoxin
MPEDHVDSPDADPAMTRNSGKRGHGHLGTMALNVLNVLGVLGVLMWASCGGAQSMSWHGVDMSEIASKGESARLEPVAGKVTVFDFWASWCAPCSELDHRLAELGRRYPDRLAIRKLEVVDGSSPAATEHLEPTTSLPHVKVFGPEGALLFELSASPAEIAARVESALATR